MASRSGDSYESLLRQFDTPEMSRLRRDAYGEDIGQHSWVSAGELRADIPRLQLSRTGNLLDLGCGPCGPLTFILAEVRCRGMGLDLSEAALEAGRKRAATLGIAELLSVQAADLNQLPMLEAGSFDAAISIDAILHVRDRLQFFRAVAKLLRPGGRLLVSDASVLTGSVSNEELQRRSPHGLTQFVPAGFNERMLESAGFRLLETENRTTSVERNAGGRLAALAAWPAELAKQRSYLETNLALARRGALSRFMYLAELPPA